MKLVERYVYDVMRRLPENQRADVAKELNAEIHDMVESEAHGDKPTKKHQYAVLEKLGNPAKLADRYREQPRYIIGPEYYESFISLLKTLLVIVVPIIVFIVLMSQLLATDDSIGETIGIIIGTAITVTVHIAFWTGLTFLLVERYGQGAKFEEEMWTPEALPELPAEQRIGRNESYFAIAWSVFAIIATLLQVPAVHAVVQPHVPLFFAPAMWPYWTLVLLGISLVGLVVELIKLRVGGWTKATVALITTINIITIGFFLSLIAYVEPVANPEFTKLIAETIDEPSAAVGIETGIKVFVGIVVMICLWEIIEAFWKYKKGARA